MKFEGKILIIGLGAVSRCTIPVLLKHLEMPRQNITVMDFAELGDAPSEVVSAGCNFVSDRLTRDNLGHKLAQYVGKGDIIVDLAWNIDCGEIIEWCHKRGVRYVNTSVEVWDPYEGAAERHPAHRTLYWRHMRLRERMASWKVQRGPTAILDHGANPGLVQHFTKQALHDIAARWLVEFPTECERRDLIADASKHARYNELAMLLGVKTIHVSERDTQISQRPKEVGEFVNTWSIEGFREEGIAPCEMGWGTHERTVPPRACFHDEGPQNQICLAQMGCRTWVRSWVPYSEIVGMVIRHGEAFSISEHLTVRNEYKVPIYRPTVHYAYCPCDQAIVSMHELHMRNYDLQPKLRIMNDDIINGSDILGVLLMGHDFKSWWIGSLLDIDESRRLVPHQNATTLQVACSVMAAVMYMIENPREGVLLPDQLPYDYILKHAKPYLGTFKSEPADWDPLRNWSHLYERYGAPRPKDEDMWQFNSFLMNNISGNGY